MFANERVASAGVASCIPAEIQSQLWSMIDDLKANMFMVDYFQVFVLSKKCCQQNIIHYQERPDYRNEVLLNFPCRQVCEIIYVIDDGNFSGMVLATEY